MKYPCLALFVGVICIASPSPAQTSEPVVMPAGRYTIQARDSTTKPGDMGLVGLPFVLKGNGSFTIMTADSLPWTGTLVQKQGTATYTDQGCGDPGVYVVHQFRGGYVLDFKSEACADREKALVLLLFVPEKSRK